MTNLAAALAELAPDQIAELRWRLSRGMSAFGVAEPLTLEEWAREHFYLSAESSYVEQTWTPWPFQRAILACMGNDDIAEVDLRKSARVGYTKMLLAAIGYFAQHKRRNQCVWQPTDDDAVDFVKTEIDTMLRDVVAMQSVFPQYLARHKDNTLQQKRFVGSSLRVRGGKAAKNFRRMSIDVGIVDEIDAFDNDVEKEGDPCTLAIKRLEGATFPKFICGSSPKLKGFSLIDDRCQRAQERFTYQIACPHCGIRHALVWGEKDAPQGFKWQPDQPGTVYHLCPTCAGTITQSDYFALADAGLWVNESCTIHLHNDGRFTDPHGERVPTPRHVAFSIWTAYSPNVTWQKIVEEFIAAHAKMLEGDDTKMKAWTNTTKGWSWEGEIEITDVDDLKARAENYALKRMPRGCLLLLAGIDTQDNRIEIGVWGYGRGGEMWPIDHVVIFGNPAQQELWDEVETFLRTQEYAHDCGNPQKIYASAIDSGGHHADAVYAFAHRLRGLRCHAVKGSSHAEKSIENGNSKVAYRWNGRVEKFGPTLWQVGTNLAKDRLQARMEVKTQGPGYVHLSKSLSDEWFKQFAGEARATRRTQHGSETRWTATRTRIEVRDCVTYAIWLEERLDLWRPTRVKWWDALAAAVEPAPDLFTVAARAPVDADIAIPGVPRETNLNARPASLPPTTPPRFARGVRHAGVR